LRESFEEWITVARSIAVAGYRRVLEDGHEICSSESSAEYSDHGEELSDAYVGDMFEENGKPVLARAVMTTEQAERIRNRGRAGGPVTVSGAGRQEV
jgi:hypothetical protein